MFNQYPYFRYRTNQFNSFNNNNPTFFIPNNYYNQNNNIIKKEEEELNNENSNQNMSIEASIEDNTQKNNENTKYEPKFRIGPINIDNDRLSIFGFNIAIDDLLIIGLIFILLLDTDCDYALIIVLGLILFNINFSSLNFLKFI